MSTCTEVGKGRPFIVAALHRRTKASSFLLFTNSQRAELGRTLKDNRQNERKGERDKERFKEAHKQRRSDVHQGKPKRDLSTSIHGETNRPA